MTQSEAFVTDLVESHEWLRPVLAEHRLDYDEVLPHVLMADVTRALVAAYLSGRDGDRPKLLAVLGDLEAAFDPDAVDDETMGVIALSFLFNLPSPGEPGDGIRRLLGRKLAGQLERSGW